ncbi:hypothetical protein BJAS_P3431 [Bathymodiolus japonicus methanotrophic gill symbiont]|uniref:hypothetical protein n=1 Tax=Bathymodiolus japonicus methanotrophic gill symbiont TaxID=113269 RepID=UPI001B6E54AC|nr:hypothetical protein [Bathymodiolus japonicus methanotrophic gill symbiont]GFO72895.1 hypothetical protein BJAS_P3431 [Bathymodiolus japonicus methanotrophic gill symbiont]
MNKLKCVFTTEQHVDYVLKNLHPRLKNDLLYAVRCGFHLKDEAMKHNSAVTYVYDGIPVAIAKVPNHEDTTIWVFFTKDAINLRFCLHKNVRKILNGLTKEFKFLKTVCRRNNDISLRWLKSLGFEVLDNHIEGNFLYMEKR